MRQFIIASTALGAVLVALAAAPAAAQGRPDTAAMTCAQAQGVVRSAGAIVLSAGPNIYDRFVASRAFCTPSEVVKPAWAPTRDDRQCFIGYRCEEFSHDIFGR